MTDVRQFGDLAARSFDCARCEAMLVDAVDGALPLEDQQFFDAHIADCTPCEHLLAEARRGAAWLEMLRTPAPEPPPALLEKILAKTSRAMPHPVPMAHPALAMAPGYAGSSHGKILPFPHRAAAAMRTSALGRIVFEPRLAMTAAMAFLSIALTMDLVGVNPMDMHARDLTPSGLHRAFAQLDAHVVQYYEGLRVVYEMESRVHDFQTVQGNAQDAAPAQNQPAASDPDQQAQPADGNRIDNQTDQSTQPDQNQDPPAPQAKPDQQQPESRTPAQRKAAPNGGVSRREEARPAQTRGILAAFNSNASSQAISAMSESELGDAIQDNSDDDLSGISSAICIAPPRGHAIRSHAERRAA